MAKNTGRGRRTGTLRRESAAPDTLQRHDSPYLLGPIGELEMFGGGDHWKPLKPRPTTRRSRMTRSQSTYQIVAGAIGGTIGIALALVVAYLTNQALWTFIASMALSGGCALAAVFVGNRIWLRREYGKGE